MKCTSEDQVLLSNSYNIKHLWIKYHKVNCISGQSGTLALLIAGGVEQTYRLIKLWCCSYHEFYTLNFHT